MTSRTHLRPANAYKQMCFDRNINGTMEIRMIKFWRLINELCNGACNSLTLVACPRMLRTLT
jgi:hypothetical protein